jgi:DNA mismatch repair protein MutS
MGYPLSSTQEYSQPALFSLTSYTQERKPSDLPPMLQQYLQYKQTYPECLLMFQVGDFYELFFDDAVTISRVLNLTLTSRDKGAPNPIPMAGVPIAVVDGYLERLIQAGYSVALVSQVGEVPPKGAVARKLDRIVTPAVRILCHQESGAEATTVAALAIAGESTGLRTGVAMAYSDVRSGIVHVQEDLSLETIVLAGKNLAPQELILPRELESTGASARVLDRRSSWVRELELALGERRIKIRSTGGNGLSSSNAQRELTGVTGYSALSPLARKAVRNLLAYLDEVTVERCLPIRRIEQHTERAYMRLDATTRQNLELLQNLRDGGRQGTLFGVLDHTVSSGGQRLLQEWIRRPLLAVPQIRERQALLRALKEAGALRAQLRSALDHVPDLERIITRVELEIASPRELGALRDCLLLRPRLLSSLTALAQQAPDVAEKPLWQECIQHLGVNISSAELLQRALVDSPPISVNEAGIIRAGFDTELDALLEIRTHGRDWILALEAEERARTGISSLKIKFNNVLGYFIELTQNNASRAPEDYIRRQSTASSERFTTLALKQREADLLGAQAKQEQRERLLFNLLRSNVQREAEVLRQLANALALLDVLQSLAEVAERENYCQPEVDDSLVLKIEAGKHPALAEMLGAHFIPNSLGLESPASADGARCYILTGPNMGGKSTFLRQTALIVLMAQIGSFVPATQAHIGIVDRLFARLGASDNMLEGESTFMVEMREATHIVEQASKRSLVIVDELGRGTATLDGLAVAQAFLEHVVSEISARTLFATHFHELTSLASSGSEHGCTIHNLRVGSVHRAEGLLFTHQILEGPADRSYGLEVARLAGLPARLLERARTLFAAYASQAKADQGATHAGSQRSLVVAPEPQAIYPVPGSGHNSATVAPVPQVPPDYLQLQGLREQICSLCLDELSPRQAWETLSKLQEHVSAVLQSNPEDL